ncbi:MAG TPA: type II secretion system F family protein [Candidatus Dormibacteraeota bacterium]|nr:type II secretion system F family protein [Candidatus Dormibacteraeota bacterium]
MAESLAFDYVARRGDGTRVRGTVHAASPDAALALVRERALVPVRVRPRGGRRAGALRAGAPGMLSGRHVVGFMHSFSTMVRAGVPLLRILDVLEEEADGAAMAAAIGRMRAALVRGEPLSQALERSTLLSPVQVSMIRAGEAGGILDDVLRRAAHVASREHALRGRVVSALAYPAVVTVAATASLVLLVSTLAPALARLFAEMSVALPPSTRLVLAAGHAVRDPRALGALLAATVAAGALAAVLRRSGRGSRALESIALRVPVVARLRRAVVVSRVARTLAALLRSGIPTLDAIELAAQSAGSPTAGEVLRRLRRSLREGESLAQRLTSGGFFPPLFVQMVRVGEESGTLDALLDAVADFYEVESDAALHALTTLIEPVLIALLGGVVGVVALAVFLPLYALIGSLR